MDLRSSGISPSGLAGAHRAAAAASGMGRTGGRPRARPTAAHASAAQSPAGSSSTPSDAELLERTGQAAGRLRVAIANAIVGQEAAIEAMLITLFARGHALLVGVPGLAKTLLVAPLARALDLSFGRVQFTPDLLPADITGTDVLEEDHTTGRRTFRFVRGPIFANLLLADEINRTPPKTHGRAAGGCRSARSRWATRPTRCSDLFQLFATRNPIEQEGTYSLPEAQLDRFLPEIHIDYPSELEEREVARRTTSGKPPVIEPVLHREDVLAIGGLVPRIPITDEAVNLAVTLARATRPQGDRRRRRGEAIRPLRRRPRGSQAPVFAATARATARGEAAADIDDVRALVLPALRHRIVLSYRAEGDGVRDADVLEVIAKSVR